MTTVERVTSPDGTVIALEFEGSGPPVVLVEPPLHYRRFSAFDGLAAELAERFTVYRYDRRGRGDSTDTAPYHQDREVEDLAAVIDHAGGRACVYGYSAGALLALRAAARLTSITRLAVLEPPLQDDESTEADPLTDELAALIAAGRGADAVEHFHRAIGVPDEYLAEMRDTPHWPSMVAVATTLVYDCAISDATTTTELRAVTVPTLVVDSAASTDNLSGWAAKVAALLPRASHRSLPGEWHTVADDVLAPVLVEHFAAAQPRAERR